MSKNVETLAGVERERERERETYNNFLKKN